MPRNPTIQSAHKTALFRIHNPSRKKRAMLDECLYRYHCAFEKALGAVMADADTLEAMAKRERKSHILAVAMGVVRPLPLAAGSKDGLIKDIEASVSSYLELLADYKKNAKEKTPEAIAKDKGMPGTPTVPRLDTSEDLWVEKLEAFHYVMTLEEEDAARDALNRERKRGNYRPVQFPRNRIKDGFSLLWNDETDRYYIYLNLHPAHSTHAKKHKAKIDGLIDLNTGEVVKTSSSTGALFPIQFGAKHQGRRFVEMAKTPPPSPSLPRAARPARAAKPVTAKLVKRGDAYDVHVAFEFQAAKIIPPEGRYMGVDRGIHNLCSMVVIDAAGRILAEKNVDGMTLRHIQRQHELRQRKAQQRGKRYRGKTRLAEAERAVHTAANEITRMAAEYEAQVVLEWLGNLTRRTKKRGRSNFNRMLGRQQFAKLESVLGYKLAVAGLPKACEVAAGYTSMTCPECGHCAPENRDRGDPENRFICQVCGYGHDADLNAGRVIALKRMWRDGLPAGERKKTLASLAGTKYGFESFLKRLANERNAAS